MDDFEVFGECARAITKATVIAYSPLIKTQDELLVWNAYAVNHSEWIENGRTVDSVLTKINHRSITPQVEDVKKAGANANIIEYIYEINNMSLVVPASGNGSFSPLWEMSPVPKNASSVNFHLASIEMFAKLLTYSTATEKPVLSEPLDAGQVFGQSIAEEGSQVSILLQPVFDGFKHGEDHNVVGTVSAVIHWIDFLSNVSIKR